MKRKYRDVQGIWMHWRELGSGTPVVLVHGLATSPALWRHVVPQLPDVRCLAWEMVGYGASIPQGIDRDLSVAQQALYLLNWLRALRIRRAVLVGHGLGGGVVQIAAREQPELCAGLVLVNSVGYDAWPTTMIKLACGLPALARRLPGKLFRLALWRFFRRGHVTRAAAEEAFALHWPHYAKHGAAAFARQACHLDLRDTRNVIAALQRLDVPMRVIWGAKDHLLPVAYGFRFARDLDAAFEYIFKGRHFTPEDHPQVVAGAINEVLAQLAPNLGAEDQYRPAQLRRFG